MSAPEEDQYSIAAWSLATFGKCPNNLRIAVRTNLEMAELLDALTADDNNPAAGAEIADIIIVLARLATEMGFDIPSEINKKMRINRMRIWKSVDGVGHHVRVGA